MLILLQKYRLSNKIVCINLNNVYKFIYRNFSTPEYDKLNSLTSKEMEELIYELTPKPEHSIMMAMFNGRMLSNITDEFKQILTDMGMCVG